jgi:hypothetical protein
MGREAQVGEWAGRPFAERGAGTAWTPERPPFDRGDEDGGCDWDRACDWDVEVSADRPRRVRPSPRPRPSGLCRGSGDPPASRCTGINSAGSPLSESVLDSTTSLASS